MTARRRRATQLDIARHVGVSQATVSLVISGGPASANVAEQTRRAVLEAAAELGYAVNPVARSLKGGRNRLLGVFTFEPVFPVGQRAQVGRRLRPARTSSPPRRSDGASARGLSVRLHRPTGGARPTAVLCGG